MPRPFYMQYIAVTTLRWLFHQPKLSVRFFLAIPRSPGNLVQCPYLMFLFPFIYYGPILTPESSILRELLFSPSIKAMSASSELTHNTKHLHPTNGVSTHHSTFKLKDSPIENFRPLKVIVIGAGYSGIYCGIRIPQRLHNIELVIYEKNKGFGGTWWENR